VIWIEKPDMSCGNWKIRCPLAFAAAILGFSRSSMAEIMAKAAIYQNAFKRQQLII
jgi:hypothetical protein